MFRWITYLLFVFHKNVLSYVLYRKAFLHMRDLPSSILMIMLFYIHKIRQCILRTHYSNIILSHDNILRHALEAFITKCYNFAWLLQLHRNRHTDYYWHRRNPVFFTAFDEFLHDSSCLTGSPSLHTTMSFINDEIEVVTFGIYRIGDSFPNSVHAPIAMFSQIDGHIQIFKFFDRTLFPIKAFFSITW